MRSTAAAIWVRTAWVGEVDTGHTHHVFKARHGFPGIVGMNRAHRAVMAGVHGLQHVDGLCAADFTKNDPVGPHSQRVLDQVTHGDLTAAFQVGRACFQSDDVRLLQLQLRGVLDCDDALSRVDQPRQGIEQSGLTRPRAAGNEYVEA